MKNFKKKIRRCVTLIEMMIVMFLIAMIIGVIAYNYQGSLDEGKAFKTKTGIDKVKTILMLYLTDHPDEASSIDSKWQDIVKNSPLVQNPSALIKDGWGQVYDVRGKDNSDGSTDIEVTSQRYNTYKSKNATMFSNDEKK